MRFILPVTLILAAIVLFLSGPMIYELALERFSPIAPECFVDDWRDPVKIKLSIRFPFIVAYTVGSFGMLIIGSGMIAQRSGK